MGRHDPVRQQWTFSLCGPQTDFDTILFLGDDESGGGCTFFTLDNDGCEAQLASEIVVDLEPGTYYVTLEAEFGSCGEFVLTLPRPCEAPAVDRPGNAVDEPETCGTNANGGCNNDPGQEEFTDLACGQTYWGTVFSTGGTRDTDWYQIEIPAGPNVDVRLSGQSQFNGVFGIIQYVEGQEGSGDCDDITGFITPVDSTFPCINDGGDPDWLVETTLSPGVWWIFAGPAFNPVVECGTADAYSISLACGAVRAGPRRRRQPRRLHRLRRPADRPQQVGHRRPRGRLRLQRHRQLRRPAEGPQRLVGRRRVRSVRW